MFDDTENHWASYNDRWYLIPVEVEGLEEDEVACQISSCYPPEGNSCISIEKNLVGCLNMKPASEKDITTWIFKKTGEIDHERLFQEQLVRNFPRIEGAIAAQPWCRDILNPAYERLNGCAMSEFGTDSYDAIPAMETYVASVIEEVEWRLEEDPDGCAVKIKNVRRAEANKAPYLAAVDGFANTVDITADNEKSATWTFEYYNNGRYRLVNDNGEYLGQLDSEITVTSDPAEAGLYAFVLNFNTVSLVNRTSPEIGLNIDNAGGNACQYNSDDAGSLWVIELVRENGINEISGDNLGNNAANGTRAVYDLRGIKVNPQNATPGIYIERNGSEVSKRLVK